jgi:hypothetical protein
MADKDEIKNIEEEMLKKAREGEEEQLQEEELNDVKLKREKLALKREETEDNKSKEENGKQGARGLEALSKATVEKSARFVVLFAFILFILDITFQYKGFNIVVTDGGSLFSGILEFILSLFYPILIGVMFYWLIAKKKGWASIISFIALMIFGLFIISILVPNFHPLILIHILYILFFWLAFIKGRDDEARANWILIGLLFADLYLFSAINNFSSGLAESFMGFPFLFFLTIAYVYKETGNLWAAISIVLVLGYYIIVATPTADYFQGIDVVKEKIPLREWPGLFIERVIKEPSEKFGGGTSSWFSSQIQYAITGKVEKNKDEPLGVYLENVQPADKKYYSDENVVVWGTVNARTLDDPIKIKLGCYVKKDSEKIKSNEVDPEDKVTVYKLEEQDFVCTFTENPVSEGVLKEGINTVTAFADFNFETLAYLKTYFINRERKRAMEREEIDIFKEFGIKDKKPISVYTNGPAALGMETTTPLIGVTKEYNGAFPRLSISLKRNKGWKGNIKELKEMVIIAPKGVKLEKCAGDYQAYDKAKCVDNCNKFNIYEDDDAGEENACESSCASFFEDIGEDENLYSIDLNKSSDREFDEDDDFKFFTCSFNPEISEVLEENSPITTKFFRAKARYDYIVEDDVTVKIEKSLPDLDK